MNTQETLRLAISHHNAGLVTEAERLYRDILRRLPGHPVAATLLARLALKRRHFAEAQTLLMVAVTNAPDYMQAHVALGECHEQAWAQGPATRAYRRALALAPEQAGTLVTLGNLEQQANNDNVAGALYRRALVIQPDSVAAANNLAAACLKCADPISALDATDRVLESNPSHVRAIAYRTVALRALGRDAEADRFLGFGSLVTSTRLDPSSRYSDLAEFNGDLADALMTHPNISSEWDSAKRAIRGGAIVPRLLEHRVPVIEAFETFLRATINGAIAALPDDRSHPYLARKPEADERGRYALDIWGNLLGRSDHQSAHIHNLGWMSGVYYVTVPVLEPDEDPRAGWIEFNRPGYGISVLGGEAGIEVIRPEPGMVILFPSYVWHGTIPFNGPGQRVSIAFDLHLPTS